jgi:hypothetical protein
MYIAIFFNKSIYIFFCRIDRYSTFLEIIFYYYFIKLFIKFFRIVQILEEVL